MNIVSAAAMQALDRNIIANGMPSILLMEHAAIGMASCVMRHVRRGKRSIVILCGTGNNGGDGLALARMLVRTGLAPRVYLFGDVSALSADTRTNRSLLAAEGIEAVIGGDHIDDVESVIASSDIIIDALFGTGVNRNIEGTPRRVIEMMNAAKGVRIALDMPSGLPALVNGSVAMKADHTIAVGLPKDIFFLEPYVRYVGRLSVVPSMFPRASMACVDAPTLITRKSIADIALPRDAFSDKRSSSVCVIAGSTQYPGAAVLAASALYRIGVGYIRLLVPQAIRDEVRRRLPPEVVTVGIGRTGDGCFSIAHAEQIGKEMKHARAILIGCGLDRDPGTGTLFEHVITDITAPLVIDADGLYFLSQKKELLAQLPSSAILTPHAGEFSRLAGIAEADVLRDAFSRLAVFRTVTCANVIMKSPITFISGERVAVLARPIYGMGKAGMGDVLAGIVTGLRARGLSSTDAMILGSFVHSRAFRMAVKRSLPESMQPSDVAAIVGAAYRSIVK